MGNACSLTGQLGVGERQDVPLWGDARVLPARSLMLVTGVAQIDDYRLVVYPVLYNEEGTAYEQSCCLHESDARRGHAGAGEAGRGPPWRLRARRLGDALRRDGAGRGKHGQYWCPAAGPTDLRG